MARVVHRVAARGWWSARTVRERRLLTAMMALLLLVFVWLLVIRPLMDARAAADQRLNAAVTELARARAEAAAKVAPAGASSAPVPLPVDGFLMQSGGEQGFTNLSVVADGASRATISMANARPQAFFAWIGQLEARGLVVESMSARANADQTIAVEAVLRSGGR
jgi:general secretion pathway protein M